MAESTASIVGLGNPLLDISAHVDQAFLDKYQVRSVARSPCASPVSCASTYGPAPSLWI